MHNQSEFNAFLKRVEGKGLEDIDDNNKIPEATYFTFSTKELFDLQKNPIMEVYRILTCDDLVFLCKCKHNMTNVHIESLINRLDEFLKKHQIASDPEFTKLLGKRYIGIACDTKFSEELRHLSMNRGLITVFSGGNRYRVEIPEKISTYWKL
ncbi:13914_t:CDS:2 [Funneliformis mosseae]|uniref:13914_t:CDS:1 n=1 Tax=Funneliformis mosseae TaxID=27381 RepID=A0A9N9DI35_FUNMO|nr:13914_t:CDS:2 [Funneliformis mosseae]